MSKKAGIDLLVRVRYSNPLPPPPYPPKLIDIPTDPKRYARVELTQNMSNEALLPMIVDSELGMPLDLCHFDSLWNGSTDLSDLNPASGPPIDPRDMFMLEGVAGAAAAGAPVNGVNVSWLRKTEYLSRDTAMVKQTAVNADAARDAAEIPVDTSLPAQIITIEATFPPTDEPIDLASLRHPTKPNVTAVDSFEFLPDPDLWANTYDIFRFAERPGGRPPEAPDPRLDCAILVPQQMDGESFLRYYVTEGDADAESYKARRRGEVPSTEEDQLTIFKWRRDYEAGKVEQGITNELLLVLDDPDDEFAGDRKLPSMHETKGAYYMTINRKIILKKKRGPKADVLVDKVDALHVSHEPFSAEEEAERLESIAEITDPAWLSRVRDAQAGIEGYGGGGTDAEGEADVEPLHPNGANGALEVDVGEQ